MKLTVKELVLFPLLGVMMAYSKPLTELLPNVHFLALLTITYTVVFRAKALYPIFIFILLTGYLYGFGTWWIPYFYLWPLLWGATMLLPKQMKKKVAVPVYMAVAGLHGLLYGTLYAPFQALVFGMSFKSTVAWIIAGLPWDLVHCISNTCIAILVLPLAQLLRKLSGKE